MMSHVGVRELAKYATAMLLCGKNVRDCKTIMEAGQYHENDQGTSLA